MIRILLLVTAVITGTATAANADVNEIQKNYYNRQMELAIKHFNQKALNSSLRSSQMVHTSEPARNKNFVVKDCTKPQFRGVSEPGLVDYACAVGKNWRFRQFTLDGNRSPTTQIRLFRRRNIGNPNNVIGNPWEGSSSYRIGKRHYKKRETDIIPLDLHCGILPIPGGYLGCDGDTLAFLYDFQFDIGAGQFLGTEQMAQLFDDYPDPKLLASGRWGTLFAMSKETAKCSTSGRVSLLTFDFSLPLDENIIDHGCYPRNLVVKGDPVGGTFGLEIGDRAFILVPNSDYTVFKRSPIGAFKIVQIHDGSIVRRVPKTTRCSVIHTPLSLERRRKLSGQCTSVNMNEDGVVFTKGRRGMFRPWE